jgi:hypothetical protein
MKQVFFVHVPKTAGMTIRSRFSHNEKFFPNRKDREHKFGVSIPYRFGSKSFPTDYFSCYLDDENFNNAEIKFTVVRNPFDQLVSYYLHDAHGTGKESGWANVNNNFGFKSFKEFLCGYCLDRPKRCHVPMLSVSLYSQLFNEDGECLVDYAVRFEKLNKGLKAISKMSDSNSKGSFISNVTGARKGRNYADFYTPELIDMVEHKMKWEFENLGYNYGGPVDDNGILDIKNLKLDISMGEL